MENQKNLNVEKKDEKPVIVLKAGMDTCLRCD